VSIVFDRTLHFVQELGVSAAVDPELSEIVPPRGSVAFSGQPNCGIFMRTVRILGRDLRASEILVADGTQPEGFRSVTITREGRLEGRFPLSPSKTALVRVHNDSDKPSRAHVIATGSSMSNADTDFVFALWPVPDLPIKRRIVVPPREGVYKVYETRFIPPYGCKPYKITMRSNARDDLFIDSIRMANQNMLIGIGVPVEFFDGGVELNGPGLSPSEHMEVSLYNSSEEERWLEIDLAVRNREEDREES
jgi:hypothetical protein